MPELITPGEFTEIRSVIQDVTDTFHQKTITYILKGESLDIHGEDRNDQDKTEYDIPGLVVWEKTSDDAKVKKDSSGNTDLTQGYVNFNFDDCDAAGLISSLKFIGDKTRDLVKFDSVTYRIIGIVQIGQFPTKDSIVRVIFERIIPNGS